MPEPQDNLRDFGERSGMHWAQCVGQLAGPGSDTLGIDSQTFYPLYLVVAESLPLEIGALLYPPFTPFSGSSGLLLFVMQPHQQRPRRNLH